MKIKYFTVISILLFLCTLSISCDDQNTLTLGEERSSSDSDKESDPEATKEPGEKPGKDKEPGADPDQGDNPDNPDNPDTPDSPDIPEKPDTPDSPDIPEKPDNPDNPDTPDNPDIHKPDNPDTPVNPVVEPVESEVVVVPSADMPKYSYSTESVWLSNNGQKIYVLAYIPDTGQEKMPIVIMTPGLGSGYESNEKYAKAFAKHGVLVYSFEPRGNGGSHSEGKMVDMSIETEVSDLEVVLEAVKTWDKVDTSRIAMLGHSQGGLVTAIASARHPNDIICIVLLSPGFILPRKIQNWIDTRDSDEDFVSGRNRLGAEYARVLENYDTYSEIGNYKNPVLLLHGSNDGTVPVSASEKAAEIYPKAEYHVISGAEHQFSGSALTEALDYIGEFIQTSRLLVLKTKE